MKMLVVSDTHRNIEPVVDVFYREKDIDLLVHLGDVTDDALALKKELGIPCQYVKGNMDGGSKSDDKILPVECGKILLTHGHGYNVQETYHLLQYMGEAEGYTAVFFGHTHIAFSEKVGDLWLFNPGSISLPRDQSGGTYGIVVTDEEGISCEIKKYGKRKKEKPQGGYLRGILNYSDRF